MKVSQKKIPNDRCPITKKGLLQTVIILVLLVFILNIINSVLMSKVANANILAGQKQTDDHYDVIFAGSSHMNRAAYPMILWERYGFTSFNNAQSGEIIPVSYYTCKEAIEVYNPQVLVLDVYMLYYSYTDGSITSMHQSLDRLSAKNRIPAILDLAPRKNWEEFLFPLTLYHARWKELRKRDFERSDSVYKGGSQDFTIAEDIVGLSFEYQPPNVKVRPFDTPLEYLDKIVNMCEETDTKLLLVALPYFISSKVKGATHDLSNDQAYFNWIADYAEKKELPYINYFHLTDEIGFDWYQCLFNQGHMNYWGGSIITEHLGMYLSEHYDLPDHRDDLAYTHWNRDLKQYHKLVQKNLEKLD